MTGIMCCSVGREKNRSGGTDLPQISMEELEQGFHIMRDKSEDYVKVMGIL